MSASDPSLKSTVTNGMSRGEKVNNTAESSSERGLHNKLADFEELGRGKREKKPSWKITESH